MMGSDTQLEEYLVEKMREGMSEWDTRQGARATKQCNAPLACRYFPSRNAFNTS